MRFEIPCSIFDIKMTNANKITALIITFGIKKQIMIRIMSMIEIFCCLLVQKYLLIDNSIPNPNNRAG